MVDTMELTPAREKAKRQTQIEMRKVVSGREKPKNLQNEKDQTKVSQLGEGYQQFAAKTNRLIGLLQQEYPYSYNQQFRDATQLRETAALLARFKDEVPQATLIIHQAEAFQRQADQTQEAPETKAQGFIGNIKRLLSGIRRGGPDTDAVMAQATKLEFQSRVPEAQKILDKLTSISQLTDQALEYYDQAYPDQKPDETADTPVPTNSGDDPFLDVRERRQLKRQLKETPTQKFPPTLQNFHNVSMILRGELQAFYRTGDYA